MRKIVSFLASKLKGKEMVIDENIPMSYLFFLGLDFFLAILRGVLLLGLGSKGKMFVKSKSVKLLCRSKIQLGNNVRLGEKVLIDGLSKYGVQLGNNVAIGSSTIIKCTGSFTDIGEGLKIGNNFGCGENCFFGSAGGIEIGNDVIMGQSVRFHAQNHNYSDINKPIREQGVNQIGIKIGNDCWIGSGVVFLDGVKVGNGCVIGANTLVNKDIPDNSIAVGNPVKVVKQR
ncbi:acyltransferase [Neobacillus niacini]|uniref:acyltransferase n=1 Tax=Neobacillus niacini TaxID=86668 RepID=UPI00203AFAFC|nr:acyltransferase [Neobacillus niacini]MCM3693174.1 acyltransferase [Neobacillus niacini]